MFAGLQFGKPPETVGRKATGLRRPEVARLEGFQLLRYVRRAASQQTMGNRGTQSHGTKVFGAEPVFQRYVRRVAIWQTMGNYGTQSYKGAKASAGALCQPGCRIPLHLSTNCKEKEMLP